MENTYALDRAHAVILLAMEYFDKDQWKAAENVLRTYIGSEGLGY